MYLELIDKLKNTSLTQKELNHLIEKCYRLSLHYFRYAHSRIYKVLSDDLKIEDVAIDAITPLFASGSENPLALLISSLETWDKPIDTESDALYFLNKIIAKRVEQHICRLYREADPFFSKILDSINYLIKKDGYKKINYFGVVYILNKNTAENSLSPLKKEDIQFINPDLFASKKNLLQRLFTLGTFNAIPLNALVNRVKELETAEFLKLENVTRGEESELYVKELTEKGLNAAIEKLNSSYFRKNKLNESEVQAFKLTLRDMANDLKDGGINPGLYEYLSMHIKEMSKETYQSKYHNILEYLLKVMRNIIAEELTV